jgi:group I intron endonuclease
MDRKQLRTGVYCILNRVTRKRYVGSAAYSFANRWKTHRKQLRSGCHHSVLLQRAWDKYGEDAFDFLVIQRCVPSCCLAVEQRWMDLLRSSDPGRGFNVSPTAGSRLGNKQSPEAIAKISAANLGKVVSSETRAKTSAALKGKRKSAEHVAKSAAAHRGRKHSEEHKRKIAAAGRGRTHSLDTKAKIGAAHRGKVLSEETRRKISETRKKRFAEAAGV